MGQIQSKDFSLGWQPNMDAVNAAPNALLRMDNCVLDELGVLALRHGCQKISPPTSGENKDIHSLFTTAIDGVRYRFWGAGNSVYVNGVESLTGVAGSGDMSFGAYLDEVFMQRGVDSPGTPARRKYDGTAWRLWGITGGVAPTDVIRKPPDRKVFSTCDEGEAAASGSGFETTGSGTEGTIGWAEDWNQSGSNKALELTMDSATFRAMSTKSFPEHQDFTALDGGDEGTDDDRISLHCYITEPSSVVWVTMIVDIDDGSFANNYYTFSWVNEERKKGRTYEELNPNFDVHFRDRDFLRDRVEEFDKPRHNSFKPDKNSWNYLTTARRHFTRTGEGVTKTINGQEVTMGWKTVKAIRMVITGVADTTVRLDSIELAGGKATPLDGRYKWRCVWVYNNGQKESLSTATDATQEVEILKGAVEVKITNPNHLIYSPKDVGANRVSVWLYRMGGVMDGYYRVATAQVTSNIGQTGILDRMSDVDAMVLNIQLDIHNEVPPNDSIGIVGPYYDRLFVLTKTHLYPSRRLAPESFSTKQTLRIGDGSWQAHWIQQASGAIYIGTDKDILALEGTGAEFPDGTMDFRLKQLNIANPPISRAVARDGNTIIYLASDGWRLFTGHNSIPISTDIELLFKDRQRHGVYPVNIQDPASRFRAAIAKGQLVIITPEKAEQVENYDTESSEVLYRYDFVKQRWYRHPYRVLNPPGSESLPYWEKKGWRIIFTEPDGTLLAGDNNGNVWQLDIGYTDDGNAIPFEIWTSTTDNGFPDQPKEATNFRSQFDSGNAAISFTFYKGGTSLPAAILSATHNGFSWYTEDLSTLGEFRQVQIRITGTTQFFRLYDYTIFYLDLPVARVLWDTGEIVGEEWELFWLREIHIKARAPSDLTVTPYFDGTGSTAKTVTVSADKTTIYQVKIGRGVKGAVPRVKVTCASAFLPYWMDIIGDTSGMTQQRVRIPG